ncbi:MAG: hypothetical protein QXO51_01030 [Halobacteria archaeon]
MLRGLSYDLGLTYISGPESRRWTTHRPLPDATLRRELRMVRSLGADAVRLHGERETDLLRAAREALGLGFEVWLSPRFIDLPSRRVPPRVAHLARGAESLRAEFPGRVVLMVANELTLDAPDFFPGDYEARARAMGAASALGALRQVNTRLNRLLREAAAAAREGFGGPLTYAAGFWERVEWRPFDLVSANLYRDWTRWWTYREWLAALKSFGRPAFVTEFGSATHAGAPLLGGAGWHLFRPFPRSEEAQAEAVKAQWRAIGSAGLGGGFVYCFAMPRAFPGDPGGTEESDKASFGIVRLAGNRVVPKRAWGAVRRMFTSTSSRRSGRTPGPAARSSGRSRRRR